MFQYGRKHFCEAVQRFGSEDLHMTWHMFKRKYWGHVDSATWEANNKAADENQGEIHAVYKGQNGREIHIIRLADCSFSLIYSQEDVDSGNLESIRRQLTERRGRRNTISMNLFG